MLLDRTIQWMFNKSRLQGRNDEGSYLELVVSSSKTLVDKSRQEIIDLAMRELAEFFPDVTQAKVVKSTVIKEIYATYSPKPGVDEYRPGAKSDWARVFLAGDWTATGWPATMEGAVRGGYLAAEAVAEKEISGSGFACARVDATVLVPLPHIPKDGCVGTPNYF